MSNTMTGREVLRAIADGASLDAFEYSNAKVTDWHTMAASGWEIEYLLSDTYGIKFRRKPRTINIRGFDVPAPEPADRLIPNEVQFYCPAALNRSWHTVHIWTNHDYDLLLLKRGLVYLSKDDAIRVAKALCGIDPNTKE